MDMKLLFCENLRNYLINIGEDAKVVVNIENELSPAE